MYVLIHSSFAYSMQPASLYGQYAVCVLIYILYSRTLIKKENQVFNIYMEIQSGAVAKPYMRKGFLIYEEMRKYFPIYEEAVIHDFATAPF
jgi:hypothetical protein